MTNYQFKITCFVYIFSFYISSASGFEITRMIPEVEKSFYLQKDYFKDFDFPQSIDFIVEKEADIAAIGVDQILLPKTSPCPSESILTQIAHETAHLVFARKMSQEKFLIANEYSKTLSILSRMEYLRNQLDIKFEKNNFQTNNELESFDKELSDLNEKLNKYKHIIYYVFPLEELFADFFALIYFDSASAMKEALMCYSLEEALERDYSKEVSLLYVPLDPYGHSDYLYFGHHFFNDLKNKNLSKNDSLLLLYNKIVTFLKRLDLNEEFNFKKFNLKLLEANPKNN